MKPEQTALVPCPAPRQSSWQRLLDLLVQGSDMPTGRRLLVYLLTFLVCLVFVWTPVGIFLALKPDTYTSSWVLILPGATQGHAISLDSVGQANATASSAYSSLAVDPKVNYKAIATSKAVLARAAARLELTAEEFGKPRIKLVDQTATMEFSLSAGDSVAAYNRSQALYCALLKELERLRSDELARREEAVNDMLQGFSDKLRQAQQRMLDYQRGSEIVSIEQFAELTVNLERMRNEINELEAERANLVGSLEALQKVLGINPVDASSILDLQRDVLFTELAGAWAEASASLTMNQARWGKKHHLVVGAEEDERELRQALVGRARKIAPRLKLSERRLVVIGTADNALYQQLLELAVQRQGIEQQLAALRRGFDQQKALLDRSTTDASNLEDLKRKHQVATAVFTTALAKLDIGKSDRFDSYPMVQLLAKPVLPDRPDRMAAILAVLGGTVGSLLVLIGLSLLWKRKPYLRKIRQSA